MRLEKIVTLGDSEWKFPSYGFWEDQNGEVPTPEAKAESRYVPRRCEKGNNK